MKIKGLHIFCSTCSVTCTNKKAKCKKKDMYAKNCQGIKKYQSRIWNPYTRRTDKIRTWGTDFNEAVKNHNQYKELLISTNFGYVKKVVYRPTMIRDCGNMYIDYLNDVDVPEHEKKKLGSDYIKSQKRYIKKFLSVVGNIPVSSIESTHVGLFHSQLSDYAPGTYNHHIGALSSLFNYLINKKEYKIKNPFSNVKLKYREKKVEIITEEEFDLLISKVSPENGLYNNRGGYSYNIYKDWQVNAFKLARLTGGRRDELFYLEWKHVEDNYLRIPNFKLNRLRNVDEHRYVPITEDLAELLIELKGSDKYLLAPEVKNREQLKLVATQSFTHYWSKTGINKKVTFKHLRKTYITRIRVLLGEKSKGLKIHKSDEVQIDHYLNQQEIQRELMGVRLF